MVAGRRPDFLVFQKRENDSDEKLPDALIFR
jgi:hypothetical protein